MCSVATITPFAIEVGSVDILQELKGQGYDFNQIAGWPGTSLLGRASMRGLRRLCGALVNIRDTVTLDTPLHHAVRGRHSMIIKELLGALSDANVRNLQTKTPIDLAIAQNDPVCHALVGRSKASSPESIMGPRPALTIGPTLCFEDFAQAWKKRAQRLDSHD